MVEILILTHGVGIRRHSTSVNSPSVVLGTAITGLVETSQISWRGGSDLVGHVPNNPSTLEIASLGRVLGSLAQVLRGTNWC